MAPAAPTDAGQAALSLQIPTQEGPATASPGFSEEMHYFGQGRAGRMASGRGPEPAGPGLGGIGFRAPDNQGKPHPQRGERKA